MGRHRGKTRSRKRKSHPPTAASTSQPPPPSPPQTLGRPMTDLPDKVLTDILSLLPAQSVCICRCVCKSFLDLTTRNPAFTYSHLSKQRTHFLTQSRTANRETLLHLVDYHAVVSGGAENTTAEINTKFYIPVDRERSRSYRYNVVNSCNGLVCLTRRWADPVIVYNPITGEYVVVDGKSENDLGDWLMRSTGDYGIGFCAETNVYKVLRFMDCESLAEVHVLGTSEWRTVDLPCPDALTRTDGFLEPMFLNGFLHWDCADYGIVSFDIKTEKFGEVPLPKHFQVTHKEIMRVSVFENCLSVSDFTLRTLFDFWVMKEYGIQQSWTKMFVVDIRAFDTFKFPTHMPIEVLSTGELLMLDAGKMCLTIHDFRDKSIRYLRFNGNIYYGQVNLHTPSFVSLKDVVGAEHVKLLCDCLRADQIAENEALVLELSRRWSTEEAEEWKNENFYL